MAKHEPMHVNPGHPMWRRLPLAITLFLTALTAASTYVALHGDGSAWVAVAVLVPITALYARGYSRIRKEQSNG